jgi:hypothetical protein
MSLCRGALDPAVGFGKQRTRAEPLEDRTRGVQRLGGSAAVAERDETAAETEERAGALERRAERVPLARRRLVEPPRLVGRIPGFGELGARCSDRDHVMLDHDGFRALQQALGEANRPCGEADRHDLGKELGPATVLDLR